MSFSPKNLDERRLSRIVMAFVALLSLALFSLPSRAAEKDAPVEGAPRKILPPKGPQAKVAEDRAARNRERWEKLSPEKRKRIERIYQEFRRLPPEERALLFDRLRSMSAVERRSFIRKAEAELEQDPIERHSRLVERELLRKKLNALSPAEREKLRSLSPKEQREYLKRKEESRRDKIVSSLPEPLRTKLKAMSPREQAQFLKARKVEQILKDTFRDEEELRRIRGLPPRRIMELVRAAARRGEKGAPNADLARPDFVSEETWKRWLALKPSERALALSSLKVPGAQGAGGKKSKPQN